MTTLHRAKWPPERPEGRSIGVGSSPDGFWYVVISDPLEWVADAGAFSSEAEAWDWIKRQTWYRRERLS